MTEQKDYLNRMNKEATSNVSSAFEVAADTQVMAKHFGSKDNINHPSHYMTKSGLEAINVIEAFTEDLAGFEAVNTGNVLKYLCRWKRKNGLEDLKKARWYLDRLISKLENECSNKTTYSGY